MPRKAAKRKTAKKPARKPQPKMLGTGMARGAAEAIRRRNKRLADI